MVLDTVYDCVSTRSTGEESPSHVRLLPPSIVLFIPSTLFTLRGSVSRI